MNHSEEWIAKGVDGLKSQAMPNKPTNLVSQMVDQKSPEPMRTGNRIFVVLAAGAVVTTGLVLMPQKTSAALKIGMVVEAQQKSGDLYHVTSYWIENGKKIPKSWHGYVKGNRWHYIQDGFELASDGRETMSYDPNTGDAQIWKDSSSESEFSSIFPSADLKWWKSDEAKGLRLEHNFLWNGQRFDKYVVTTHSQDWGATTNTLYVDPATNRPIYGEFLHSSGNGNALKWDYPNPQVESVLEIKLRPGTKVIDVTDERARIR